MAVRGKFKVQSIKKWSDSASGEVELSAVADDGIEENKRYSQATPFGTIKLTINNPAAFAEFGYSKDFYVDFTPIEKDKE